MQNIPELSHWLANVDDLALSSTAADPREEFSYIAKLDQLIDERPEGANVFGLRGSLRRSRHASRNRNPNAGHAANFNDAFEILPDEAGYMVSRAAPDTHIASVLLCGQRRETTSVGRSLGLAIVGAVALSLVESHAVHANRLIA